jgi:hypothetical protein
MGSPRMRYSAAKRKVQLAFQQILARLDALGREPDHWEEVRLVKALCSMTIDYLQAAGTSKTSPR